jgi:hypothetical protein
MGWLKTFAFHNLSIVNKEVNEWFKYYYLP